MHYRKSTKEDASLQSLEKICFLSGILAFLVVISLLKPLRDANNYLPAVLFVITGLFAASWAGVVIVRHKRDKQDGIVEGLQPIVIMAYLALAIVGFFLLFTMMILFLTLAKHGDLGK